MQRNTSGDFYHDIRSLWCIVQERNFAFLLHVHQIQFLSACGTTAARIDQTQMFIVFGKMNTCNILFLNTFSTFCMTVTIASRVSADKCQVKWRHERSSRLIRNLSNCKREAWKKFRLQRDSNLWPLRYRCRALPTELWSHNCWEQVNFSGSIMPLRVIQHYSDWVCTAVMSKWSHERSSRLIRNLSNCEREAWKKIQASAGFEPVTSAIPVQCSTNWAMKP